MTKNSPDYETKCPNCKSTYHPKNAQPAIKEPLNKIYILYALCPECKDKYDNANKSEKKSIASQCFLNFKIEGKDPSGEMYPWSVTTEIALHTNGYEIDQALIHGQNIPREIYNLVEHGAVKIQCLPTNLYGMQPLTLVLD
jgi:hypothetical protein